MFRLWTISPRVRWRPQRYIRAPARIITTAPPIAIPAIAPPERAGFDDVAATAVGVVVLVGVVEVVAAAVELDGTEEVDVGATDGDFDETSSLGNDSPGLNITVALWAYAFWTSRVWVSFCI